MSSDRRRWDERYRTGEYVGPDGPSWLLEAFADALPPGRAIDVACGTGRNARFLAERGWTVDAVDVSRVALTRGRQAAARDEDPAPGRVNWIQADVDSHCFPSGAYGLVNVTFYDARDRLAALKATLEPGGVLCYHHHLLSPDAEGGPSDTYRFASNELLELCADLTILHYEERLDERAGARHARGAERGGRRAALPGPVRGRAAGWRWTIPGRWCREDRLVSDRVRRSARGDRRRRGRDRVRRGTPRRRGRRRDTSSRDRSRCAPRRTPGCRRTRP